MFLVTFSIPDRYTGYIGVHYSCVLELISFQMNFLVRVLYYNETLQDGCTSLCNNTKLKYYPSV